MFMCNGRLLCSMYKLSCLYVIELSRFSLWQVTTILLTVCVSSSRFYMCLWLQLAVDFLIWKSPGLSDFSQLTSHCQTAQHHTNIVSSLLRLSSCYNTLLSGFTVVRSNVIRLVEERNWRKCGNCFSLHTIQQYAFPNKNRKVLLVYQEILLTWSAV